MTRTNAIKASRRRAGKREHIPPFAETGHTRLMPEYRRNRVPGGIFFLTLNLLDRRPELLVAQCRRAARRSAGARRVASIPPDR
jgi:hypothetical protein